MLSVAWETGVEFDESERLQTSVSDDLVLSSCAGTGSPWKLDLFRMEVPAQSVLEKHTSCSVKNLKKNHDSFEAISLHENNGTTLPKAAQNFELAGKSREKRNDLRKKSAEGDCSGTVSEQKRSRKPTVRYIQELEDSLARFSKKRQGSSSIPNNKNGEVRGCNKRCVVSSPESLSDEDTSIVAIQVPFAAVPVQKECWESERCDSVSAADCGKLTSKPKQSNITPKTSQTKREDVSVASVDKRRERLAARQQKRSEFVNSVSPKKKKDVTAEARPKKRKEFTLEPSPKTKNNVTVEPSPKKSKELTVEPSPVKQDKQVAPVSTKKKDDCNIVSNRKKSNEEIFSPESLDEVSGKRKHHILWAIEEVEKLLDGVSQFGVGKWSRIKKLHFSSSSHRTCVDLKDKWRNLLKASGIMERGSRQGGKKRHVAWRPLPESVIDRVRELAALNNYPKDQTKPQEVLHNNSHDDDNDEEDDSSDTSTDVTLNHYRKILRSISDN